MPKKFRIVGLPDGAADPERQEVHFKLGTSDGRDLVCVAKIGIAEQIIAALWRMVQGIREERSARGISNTQTTAAEDVGEAFVQREPWADRILLRLVSANGVPFTFALTSHAAKEIAARLQAESAKTGSAGTA